MPQTIDLQSSINFVTPILKNQPLMVSNNEPAQSAANLVLGTMLAPPFKWAFNRQSFNFTISLLGGTDYTVALPDWGFLETQWLADGTGKVYQLGGETSLAKETGLSRPAKMSAQLDDGTGNITFRMSGLPDQAYVVFINYQRRMVPLGSTAAFWGPVPDRFAYIYNTGFLAFMSLLVNDARFPIFENLFLSRLLGAQDGLTDQERDIFLANWVNVMQTMNRGATAVTASAQARGR